MLHVAILARVASAALHVRVFSKASEGVIRPGSRERMGYINDLNALYAQANNMCIERDVGVVIAKHTITSQSGANF